MCVCACVCIPWAVAGALPVHDSSSAGSRAVGPLWPGRPLAVHRPGTMFTELDALTSTAPLDKTDQTGDWRLRKWWQAGKAFLSASLGNTSFLSFQHAWTHKCFRSSQHTHAHTQACNTPQPIQVKHCTHTNHRFSLTSFKFQYRKRLGHLCPGWTPDNRGMKQASAVCVPTLDCKARDSLGVVWHFGGACLIFYLSKERQNDCCSSTQDMFAQHKAVACSRLAQLASHKS